MERRTFCTAALSLAGAVVAGCTVVGDAVGPEGTRGVIQGTPFTVDLAVQHNRPGGALPAGTPIRGRPIPMGRTRVMVTTGRGALRQTDNYRV